MGNIPTCPYENKKKLEGILGKLEREIESRQRKINDRKEEKILHENNVRELTNQLEDLRAKLADMITEEEREETNEKFHKVEEEIEKETAMFERAKFGVGYHINKKKGLLGRKDWTEETLAWATSVVEQLDAKKELTQRPFENLELSAEE